jgi:hypothetical protein
MEVGQGPNVGCSAKGKKMATLWRYEEESKREMKKIVLWKA